MLYFLIYFNVESRFEGRILREEYGLNFGIVGNGLFFMLIVFIKIFLRIKDIESFFLNNSGFYVWF